MRVCICILALAILQEICVFSAPHYIVICGLSGCTIFSHMMSVMVRFSGGGVLFAKYVRLDSLADFV
jgi:hypothetical protein